MNKYVSLLRGINVGGRNIKMTDLKACYEKFGLEDVKTILQSGNVTFWSNETDTTALSTMLEKAVSERFKYNAKIFVFDIKYLTKIRNDYPFASSDDTHQDYIVFIDKGLETRLFSEGKSLKSDLDKIAIGKGVVYWRVPKGNTLLSPFSKLLVKKEFKDSHTNRNTRTIDRLIK